MTKADFTEELLISKSGFELIIGVDEVGRGALAGPLITGAVSISISEARSYWESLGIDDSKRLSPKKREELNKIILGRSLAWGIGKASVLYINRFGIVKATQKAMREAIANLVKSIPTTKKRKFLLIDAFNLKYVPGIGLKNQKAIIKGDQKSISIAAASIIAKVYRDQLMVKLDRNKPNYNWKQNKGYGTKVHLRAIKTCGPSNLHRRDFID